MGELKNTVADGFWVKFDLAVECLAVSEARLSARPNDRELIGDQLAFEENETAIVGAEDMEDHVAVAMRRSCVGEPYSWGHDYEEYDAENVITVPLDVLKQAGIPAEAIKPGLVIGLDVLHGEVKVDDDLTELEVLEVKKHEGARVVVLDANSPRAGLKCRFDVVIKECREPTADEMKRHALAS